MQSHPMWVRGLKLDFVPHCHFHLLVAPHVGAWIETELRLVRMKTETRSHPMWVRGLKRFGITEYKTPCRRTPCGCVD